MTDLTKITTPFGLLDKETQKALKGHGGPYEIYQRTGHWLEEEPQWQHASTYRVKPQPPKPREWWINYYNDLVLMYQPDKDGSFKKAGYIHVREVLE